MFIKENIYKYIVKSSLMGFVSGLSAVGSVAILAILPILLIGILTGLSNSNKDKEYIKFLFWFFIIGGSAWATIWGGLIAFISTKLNKQPNYIIVGTLAAVMAMTSSFVFYYMDFGSIQPLKTPYETKDGQLFHSWLNIIVLGEGYAFFVGLVVSSLVSLFIGLPNNQNKNSTFTIKKIG